MSAFRERVTWYEEPRSGAYGATTDRRAIPGLPAAGRRLGVPRDLERGLLGRLGRLRRPRPHRPGRGARRARAALGRLAGAADQPLVGPALRPGRGGEPPGQPREGTPPPPLPPPPRAGGPR